MSFDRARSLRRIKPQRRTSGFARRLDQELPFVGAPTVGREILLDSCVSSDILQGKTPTEIDELLRRRTINHSTTALSELTHLFGRLDPVHPGTRNVLDALSHVIDDIPAHRLTAPSVQSAAEAGMLAGLTGRLAGGDRDLRLLNDALLFLQARETGCSILTRNVADFDVLDQLLPGSEPLLYRTC